MIYVVAIVVAVASFGLVAYPLFQRRDLDLASEVVDPDLEDLQSRREAVYGAIKELDFEYQLGNLSEPDYQSLRNQYRQRAASVLKEIDDMADISPIQPQKPITRDLDAEIEEAVRQIRAGAAKSRPGRPAELARLCPDCGVETGTNDRFCASCGTELAKARPKSCPDCGAGLEPGDKFCPACGGRLARGKR